MINAKTRIFVFMLLVVISSVSAHSDHLEHSELEQAEAIINVEIPCNNLTAEQLEYVGEYFMEQMHPGAAHDLMHQHMGLEEGTTLHDQFHTNIAKMMYCGEVTNTGTGMMPMARLGDMMGPGMMNQGMMGNSYPWQYNMMYSYSNWVILIILGLLAFFIGTKFTKKK